MNIVSSPVIGICGQINWHTKMNETWGLHVADPGWPADVLFFCCSGDFGFWLSFHLSHDRVDPRGRLRKERPRDTRGNDHWGIGDEGSLWSVEFLVLEGGLFRKKNCMGRSVIFLEILDVLFFSLRICCVTILHRAIYPVPLTPSSLIAKSHPQDRHNKKRPLGEGGR